jgi:hypothetical protein
VSNGEACTGVDWGERCLVAAAHGNAERCRSGRRKAAVEFGSGAQELTKRLEKRNAEVGVALMRVRDRGLRLRGGLSSAAMRWRPAEAQGTRGALGAGQRGEATAATKVKVTRGEEESRRWTAASTAERRPGGKFCAGGKDGKRRSRGCSEVEEEGESPRTGLENLKSPGVSQ